MRVRFTEADLRAGEVRDVHGAAGNRKGPRAPTGRTRGPAIPAAGVGGLLALQRSVGNTAVQHVVRGSAGPLAAVAKDAPATADPRPVQRRLKVGDIDLTSLPPEEQRQEMADLWRSIERVPAYAEHSAEEQQQMRAQFEKWVLLTPGTPTGHSPWGRKNQNRVYDKVEDLEAALHGWVTSKPGRRAEKAYATDIVENPEIELRLNSVLSRVLRKLVALQGSPDEKVRSSISQVLVELQKSSVLGPTKGAGSAVGKRPIGWYKNYFDARARQLGDKTVATRFRSMMDVMQAPYKFGFRDKMVVIHDLMEYFGEQRPWQPRSAGGGSAARPGVGKGRQHRGHRRRERKTTLDRGRVTYHQSTRNEAAPSTRFARRHNLPVWSGASHTTVNMLTLASWVDSTRDEMTAVAHGIFAFWRVMYDHTSPLAPHTLHEVLDVAQNFGIRYDPLQPYATLDHSDRAGEQEAIHRDLVARWEELQAQLEQAEDLPGFEQFLDRVDGNLARLDRFFGGELSVSEDKLTEAMTVVLNDLVAIDLKLAVFARKARQDGGPGSVV